MKIKDVIAELRAALGTVAGLRVPEFGVSQIQTPAAVVAFPQRVEYDKSYKRGMDMLPDVPIVVLVGRASDRSAHAKITAYADGAGASSVKAALEAYAYTKIFTLVVTWAEFEEVEYAGTPYQGIIFHCEITGNGQ